LADVEATREVGHGARTADEVLKDVPVRVAEVSMARSVERFEHEVVEAHADEQAQVAEVEVPRLDGGVLGVLHALFLIHNHGCVKLEGNRKDANMSNLERAKAFLRAIEAREDITPFLAPDIVQREFPNRLVPNGATRDLSALLDANERGRRVVTSERYEVLGALESGDEVALEVRWTATLGVPLGAVPAGGTLQAHFGVFMSFRDGRIVSQRNYDCFEPF